MRAPSQARNRTADKRIDKFGGGDIVVSTSPTIKSLLERARIGSEHLLVITAAVALPIASRWPPDTVHVVGPNCEKLIKLN